MAAPLGDDVFGDDPTVNALQQRIADIDRRGCSRDAENFVLHHRRFADATLRLSGMGRQYDGKTDCW